jgi:hypothetical protein
LRCDGYGQPEPETLSGSGLLGGWAGSDAPMCSLVMTTGQFEQYVIACGEPVQAGELPPPAIPDMGRVAAAGERFRIETLGPPPRRRGRKTNHNGSEFIRRSPGALGRAAPQG